MLRTLHHGWTLRPVAGPAPTEITAAGPIPATIPGTVHTDLLAAGLIADPYLDDNERLLAWIGLCDWAYQSTFDWTPDGHDVTELVFDGLDTVAQVHLNDTVIAETANQHRTYRLDVTGLLRPGANTLSVTFSSPVRYADDASMRIGARPHVNHHPYNAIRKTAANFGWDWGPDLATAGIWRPVSLHSWSTARLATVRPVVTVDGTRGSADVHVEIARDDTPTELVLAAAVAGQTVTATLPAGQSTAVLHLQVADVQLWWPRGHGQQPLYDLDVTMHAAVHPDQALQHWHTRVGFRTVTLDTSPDEHGTRFTFVINGRPVFVKGANWIPDDVFPHRVTRTRYAQRIAQAADAGINLLRVWGGGIVEADDFYAECDEHGIMTWQDFLFACAAYSEQDPLRAEVVAEVRDNVTRIMPHPSLVLWNGGNENIWGYADWGWQLRLDGQSWGHGYYHGILPAIVAELDPHRAYTPSSPFSPDPAQHPNDPAHGSMHIWDVWNQVDYTVYRSYRPRFAAEFGWQGPPTWSTLRRALSDDPLTPQSPGMLVHQKAMEGNFKLTGGLVPHFRLPSTIEDWHWAMSLNQARAISTAVEHFRASSPVCAGSVMWQLNDCWPVVSWAAIDGDGRRKPTFYALRHAHADRLLTIQPVGDGLRVVLVNDTGLPWTGEVEVSRCDYSGKARATAVIPADCAPWSTQSLTLPANLATTGSAAGELLIARLHGQRGVWFFAEDRHSDLTAPDYTATAVATPTGAAVTVTAKSLIRDLALLADKVAADASVDDMLITLLPGESVTFDVTAEPGFDPQALLEPRVLRSANQLVAAT
ncbi:glycoside hydrolase family 2 protein [Micromonospora sp. CPCC 206060]|uniref:glycoside hydrolase family 2 protein n=1 Tax=Micromonospora sp. CPCC 206060 TaxID=3122406 RepID=UPI002FF31FEF